MRKLKKNTRRYFVNLFADFILSKFDKSINTIIQVTDCDTFIVVNGKTTSSKVLEIIELKFEFIELNKELFNYLGKEDLNIIDIIKYDQEIPNFKKEWINVNKSLYVEQNEPISEINISSEFPYGHSLECGRGMYYYSHYIFNHMYSLLGVSNLFFLYSNHINHCEEYEIDVILKSKYSKDQILSLVLDVFNMDLKEFNQKLLNYNFTEDITKQSLDKPYLVQDRLINIVLI